MSSVLSLVELLSAGVEIALKVLEASAACHGGDGVAESALARHLQLFDRHDVLGQLQAAGFDAVAGEDYAALELPRSLILFEADRT